MKMKTKDHGTINDVAMSRVNDNMFANTMSLIQTIKRIYTKISDWREVYRQRRELRELSDHLLKDIGISRSDAMREASRAFWDNTPDYDVTLRKRGKSGARADGSRGKLTCCTQA